MNRSTRQLEKELKKYMETNENENTTIQILRDAAKAVLTGKYIAIQAYLKKQEKSQIQNITAHLKEIEAEQQRHSKPSRRREIIQIRAEINNIESKKTGEQINETKSWFFEKINRGAWVAWSVNRPTSAQVMISRSMSSSPV